MIASRSAYARFCIRCGRERLPAARFCVGCGFQFTDPGAPLRVVHELSPDSPYPVRFSCAYQARHSRPEAAFRLVFAVPHLLVWTVFAAASLAVAPLCWLSVLAAGRVPAQLHRFQAAALAYTTRLAAYLCLVTDRWPPFPWQPPAGQPAQVEVDPPLRFSRLVALVVAPRAVPAVITALMWGVVAWMLAVGAWCAILATGRLPRTIHEMLELSLGFQCRTLGHFPLLLTAAYPWYESGPLMLASRRADHPGTIEPRT
jgi:Domain of unknown function (DUF4389)